MNNLFKIFALVGVIISMVASDGTAEGDFQEPCKDSHDVTQCVRDYFGKHASCSVVQSADDEPTTYEGSHYAYVPSVNMTFVLNNHKKSKLNGKVEKFYINQKSGSLVFSVNFEGIFLDCAEADLILHQRSSEPIIIRDHINGTYPAVITAVIPANGEINVNVIKSSMITAYLPQKYFNFNIGSKFLTSTDPLVSATRDALIGMVPTVVKELFLTGSPDFFISYLQKYICNFGIKLSELY